VGGDLNKKSSNISNVSTMPLIMSVYYLSNQFWMNLNVGKPCVVIKGTIWVKNIVFLLGNLFYHTRTQTKLSKCPKYII
jgi:hypothetical protein